MAAMKQIRTIDCKQSAVRAVRHNYDGEYCLTCGSDKTVKLWSYRKGLLLNRYEGHRYEVLDAASSHDSSNIVSGGMDKVALVWDVSAAQVIRALRGHTGQVNCVKYNLDSSIIMSGSFDGTLRLWDAKSKSRDPIQILDEAKDSVTSVGVSDHEIITGSLDGKIRRYDIRQGMYHVDDVKSSVGSVCFTSDGQCILVSCISNRLLLIDKDTGDILQEFKGHKNEKYKIDSNLMKNDSVVISGSEDGHVYCWSLTEGKLVEKFTHANHRVVHSLSSHSKKDTILTAAEGNVYVWDKVEEDLEIS